MGTPCGVLSADCCLRPDVLLHAAAAFGREALKKCADASYTSSYTKLVFCVARVLTRIEFFALDALANDEETTQALRKAEISRRSSQPARTAADAIDDDKGVTSNAHSPLLDKAADHLRALAQTC